MVGVNNPTKSFAKHHRGDQPKMENKIVTNDEEYEDEWDDNIPDIPQVTDEIKLSEKLTQLIEEEFDVLKKDTSKKERDIILSFLATILYKHLIPNSTYNNASAYGINVLILYHLDELYYVKLIKEDDRVMRLKHEDYAREGREKMDANQFYLPCNCGAPLRLFHGEVTTILCMKCKKKGISIS